MKNDEATYLAERVEAQYLERFQVGAPLSARRELGIQSRPVGSGIAVAMSADTSDYWNKVAGFGCEGALSEAEVSDAIAFFREANSTTTRIAAAPVALPDDWADLCFQYGLIPDGSQAKLWCPVERFKGGSTGLSVRELAEDEGEAWGHVVQSAFGMTEPDLSPLLRATIADPIVRVFGAFDGATLVGAGAVFCFDETASINTGATLATHRQRGAQTALLTARVAAAREMGCRWLVAETTSPDAHGVGNGSFRNITRAGFEHLYDRPEWRWRDQGTNSTSITA